MHQGNVQGNRELRFRIARCPEIAPSPFHSFNAVEDDGRAVVKIDNAAERGIAAVIQPGGSMRDEEVISAANDAGMAMVFTGMRHFRH